MPGNPNLSTLLIDQLPDAAIYAGSDGIIEVWNTAAERIFGYSAADAIGKNLDIIIPERFREQHWTGYERALAAGETKYVGKSLPTRAQKQDGTLFYVELGFSIVLEDGKAIGALATARDITERFERERADRQKMRDMQAQLEPAQGSAPPG